VPACNIKARLPLHYPRVPPLRHSRSSTHTSPSSIHTHPILIPKDLQLSCTESLLHFPPSPALQPATLFITASPRRPPAAPPTTDVSTDDLPCRQYLAALTSCLAHTPCPSAAHPPSRAPGNSPPLLVFEAIAAPYPPSCIALLHRQFITDAAGPPTLLGLLPSWQTASLLAVNFPLQTLV
jgi:hypothetical protein